jgi:hypothetical protein
MVLLTVVQALLIIGGGLALALAGLLWVRHRYTVEWLRKQHEVAGFLVAVVGVMYGVLVASVVVMVWAQFEDARDNVIHEAGAVATFHRLAEGLPEDASQRIEDAAETYVHRVVEDEWPAMGQGQVSLATQSALEELWALVRDARPTDAHEVLLQDKLLDQLERLTELRRARLAASTDGLSWLLWLVLIAGAVITVAYCYLFGVDQRSLHMLLVGMLTLMICLDIFLIAALDLPFSGVLVVRPDAFDLVERVLQQP